MRTGDLNGTARVGDGDQLRFRVGQVVGADTAKRPPVSALGKIQQDGFPVTL